MSLAMQFPPVKSPLRQLQDPEVIASGLSVSCIRCATAFYMNVKYCYVSRCTAPTTVACVNFEACTQPKVWADDKTSSLL